MIPVFLGILGILFFSTKAVFVKLAYAYGISSVPLLALRMVFSLPFYIASMIILGGKSNPTSRKDLSWIFLFGFMGYYLASYLDFQGLQYIKASVERLILFIYPSLVLLLSALFLKQKATRIQVVALTISYVGILFVFVPEVEAGDQKNTLLGGLLVFLSGLSYAGYLVGSGWLIPKIGATRFTTYCMMVSCSIVILHYLIQGGSFEEITAYPYQVYVIALIMAVISTVVPSYLISLAIKELGANQFAIFASLGPISTIVLAYFFLEETLTMTQLAGGVIVIAGIIVAEKFKAKTKK